MKKLLLIICCTLILIGCREQKKETMIPVENNNGIGDGAPSLDSLIQQQKTEPQPHQLKDTL